MTKPVYTTLNEDTLLEFLTLFYGRIRIHPVLGDMFKNHIGDDDSVWAEHIAHIATFWNAIFLKTQRFTGNPMQKHLHMDDLQPEHFDMWLQLFHRTALETFDVSIANAFITTSNRIAQSLQMGINIHRQKSLSNLDN